MSIFVVLEFIDIDLRVFRLRSIIVIGEHHDNIGIIIVRLGFFLGHFHPSSLQASLVVTE